MMGVERGPQRMAHVGEELALAAVGELGRVAGPPQLALAALLFGDLGHGADDAAVAGPALGDPQPPPVAQLHIERGGGIGVLQHALAHPFLDAAGGLGNEALGGDGARHVIEAGADDDQIGAHPVQLAELLVEEENAILGVVEDKGLGYAVERVHQLLLGLGGHGLGGGAGADVAHERDIDGRPALLHLRDRQVHGKGHAVAPPAHDAARGAAAADRGQQRRGGAGAVAESGGARQEGRKVLPDDLLGQMIEDALGGRVERADRAHPVDGQQAVEGIVDDAPHERVLVAQRQALREQPDALVLDAAGEADAIGEQRGDDPRRGIHDDRKLQLSDDRQRLQAEDDRHRAGQPDAPRPDAEARSRDKDDQ